MGTKSIVSKTPDDIGNPQANFDRKKFDDFITNKGYKCYIERAMKCPCRNKANGQGDSDCKNCLGTGWFFIERTETTLICTSMSNRSKFESWSENNMGIVNISCRAQDKLGFMDKVTLIELESWFSEVLFLKQSITEDENMFSFTIYSPKHLFEVYLFIDGANPLRKLTKEEYSIRDNKIIVKTDFITDLGIQDPKITVRYTHNPTYHIIDINRDLIKQKSGIECGETVQYTENFPLNCVGKRAHYIMDALNYSGDGVYDNTDYTTKNNYDR